MSIDATADPSFRKPELDERLNAVAEGDRGGPEVESNYASELDVARLYGKP